MAEYTIKDVETLTGIKAHTLRVWEKRYGFACPERTCTNIRTYNDDEVKRLLSVAVLYNQGVKVSKIAALSPAQRSEKIVALTDKGASTDATIENLILAMIDMDENRFEKIFNTSILKMGFENTISEVIYPFMERIGVLWLVGTIDPAQEHFVSNIVRQKLIVAIDAQNNPASNTPSYLLFLREGEWHELGLLFYYYLIKKAGYKVIYLGQSVPYSDLVSVVRRHKPDYLLTSFVAGIEKEEFRFYLEQFSSIGENFKLFVSGYFATHHQAAVPENIHLLQSVTQFKTYLAKVQ